MSEFLNRDADLRLAAAHDGLLYPDDVLAAQGLTTAEKRAILASWASDERAVFGDPTRRQLPCGAIVRLREITQALAALDRRSQLKSGDWRASRWSSERRRRIAGWLTRRGPPPDDDDDPPPVQAAMTLNLAAA